MTLEKFDDSARAFIRGAWPLCLIAMPNMLILAAFHDPDIFFFILYSLAGCMIFVRGFGLATFWPIYGLTLAAFLAGFPSSNEMTQVEHIFWNIAVRLRVKKKVQNLSAMWYKEFAKNFATQGDFGHESP